MWRNSVRLNTKLANVSSKPPLLLNGLRRLVRSNSSASEITSASNSVNLTTRSNAAASFDFPSSGAATSFRIGELSDVARHYVRCYWELSKARLSMLVVATSGTGYILGSGSSIDYLGLCCTCAGTMMVAASANSLNQVFEVSNDAKMNRTRRRPLPSGRITVPHVITWASSVGVAGTALLACEANMLAASLAASNLFLYAFLYTPLKQIHLSNTWVGAVVGAIPPLLGQAAFVMVVVLFAGVPSLIYVSWSFVPLMFICKISIVQSCLTVIVSLFSWWAAASGDISLNGMILPAALYLWQIPHFMALAYLCRKDYADGGFKMFSLADATGHRTALVALRNCMYLLPLGYLAYDWGLTSGWFCLESTLLALAISSTAASFYLNRTTQSARRMFHASLLYLPVFMGGLLIHRLPDNEQHVTLESGNKLPESSSSEIVLEHSNHGQESRRPDLVARQPRPPVAYASVAPFPFLPAPLYVS